MGCLLVCFGRRKNSRRQRRRESFQPRLNRISEGSIKDVRVPTVEEKEVPKYAKDYSFVEEEEVPKISELSHHLSVVEQVPEILELSHDLNVVEQVPKISELYLSVKEVPKTNVVPTTDICAKSEEKHSPSPNRKRVTFDSNIKTYEHIVVEESIELVQEKKQEIKSLELKQGQCSSSEGSDITSNSSGSYPLNHRYQNCRESDDDDEDEEDVTDCDESDLDDNYDDDDDDDDDDQDQDVYTEEIADNVKDIERLEEDKTRVLSDVRARDRTGYVNAVLKPIENLNQWKAVKSRGRKTQKRKENMIHASFSLEPNDDETKKKRTQEVAVDASLSTWLTTSSQTTTIGCNSLETANVREEV